MNAFPNASPLTVLKFGSSVLAGEADLPLAVHEIYRFLRRGHRVLAVVSALGRTTDRLLGQAHRYGDDPAPAGVAGLLATGEATAAALLTLALDRAGVPAALLDPRQARLRTCGPPLDATPCGVDAALLRRRLAQVPVAVLPGFVGVAADGTLALFGRGGTDLTALYLAHHLEAAHCRLIKDVDGIYDSDPGAGRPGGTATRAAGTLESAGARCGAAGARMDTAGAPPRRYRTLSWADAAALGGRVVQAKALAFAARHQLPFVVAAPGAAEGTEVGFGPTLRDPEAAVAASPPAAQTPAAAAIRGSDPAGVRTSGSADASASAPIGGLASTLASGLASVLAGAPASGPAATLVLAPDGRPGSVLGGARASASADASASDPIGGLAPALALVPAGALASSPAGALPLSADGGSGSGPASVLAVVASVSADGAPRDGLAAASPIFRAAVDRALRVVLLGHGTVGGGVYRHLAAHRDRFEVVGVAVRDVERHARAGVPAALLSRDAGALLERPCDLVVELLGGEEPAAWLIGAALGRGLDVVSANKAVLAGAEVRLGARAAAHGARLLYAAAVGGAVPALEAVARAAAAGEVRAVSGVVNGTCNFVLDRLSAGVALEEAVREAREKGFAEADPSRDLDGRDAACKLRLLARAAFGVELLEREVECRGILAIDGAALAAARASGRVVRLVAECRRQGDRVRARVRPVALPARHFLAGARGEENRLLIERRESPPLRLCGRGAGRWATAESVMADVWEIARSRRVGGAAASPGVSSHISASPVSASNVPALQLPASRVPASPGRGSQVPASRVPAPPGPAVAATAVEVGS